MIQLDELKTLVNLPNTAKLHVNDLNVSEGGGRLIVARMSAVPLSANRLDFTVLRERFVLRARNTRVVLFEDEYNTVVGLAIYYNVASTRLAVQIQFNVHHILLVYILTARRR